MELGFGNTLLPGDPRLVDHIVGEVKSQGIFDQFRKECIADVDTKPAYQNLRTRVESSVNSFLSKQKWKPDLNKNQLRETLRKQMFDASYLDAGVERIVDQVVNPKTYSVFMPQVEDVVYKFLGLEKPKREKNGSCAFKDLLPIDLDPVSPESDKNSLKDISLDSVDANMADRIEMTERDMSNIEQNDNIDNNGPMNIDNDGNNSRFEIENEESPGSSVKIASFTPPHPGLVGFEKPEDKSKEENENGQMEEVNEEEEEEDEEEEEESPVFEPIEAINLHESNISNDSHLSGISELTSHRSRSPVFLNDFSRDNMDFSNQDSQLSKVSSDSRLSIVTDFGSSNQASTPISENLKDDNSGEKFSKDNFKAIRDEISQDKDSKIPADIAEQKEYMPEIKDGNDTNSSKNLSSKESSRDATDNSSKDIKTEHKEKHKSRERSKSSKERSESRESKNHKDREKDSKRKRNHSECKTEHSEKSKSKDKSDHSNEKSKDYKDQSTKSKDEKLKESSGKESKDLKDIYKEKIRELREKKELTEKEKLNKNKETKDVNKENKVTKESKDKRDSSKDKKEHRSSTSSRNHSSSRHDNKSSSKSSSKDDSKNVKSENRDKSKRDERRHSTSKDNNKSRQSTESIDKADYRKSSKSEKDEKTDGKKEVKSSRKDSRSESHVRSSEKSESRRDKSDSESKDRKRRDEKKSKPKDDHSSLRKNSTDRRSSDRDGSNGSNGKSFHKSTSSPSTSSTKPTSSSLNKESTNVANSSETSDSIEEPQVEKSKSAEREVTNADVKYEIDENSMRIDLGQNEISLPLKKRPLQDDEEIPSTTEKIIVKKPKFARNFQEAKKLMKIRKKMEQEKVDQERKSQSPVGNIVETNEIVKPVPDEERVQIIEVRDEDEDEDGNEPYPENQCNFPLDGQSKIILEGNEVLNNRSLVKQFNPKSNLSEMELSIRQSLAEMISDGNMHESGCKNAETASSSRAGAEDDDQSNKQQKSFSENIIDEIQKDLVLSAREQSFDKTEKSSRLQLKQFQRSVECKQNDKSVLQRILETSGSSVESFDMSDEEDCLYFIEDNGRLDRFTKFLESLNVFKESIDVDQSEKLLNREIEISEINSMAPPQPKRKYSTSPLSDILMNNSNNNNNGMKIEISGDDEEGSGPTKKKRITRPRRQRSSLSSQGSMNGESFVMPLSPDSDVSATSEKILSSTSSLKDEKNRPRGSSQRYTSDDLYKPRPLFASSSRRSRRSNQT